MLLKKDYFQSKISSIRLPRAKSIVIRYMIWHFLRTGKILSVMEEDAEDVKITRKALLKIANTKCSSSEYVVIDVGECGAALRFLLPLLALRSGKWHLTGSNRLLQRPITSLLDTLLQIGAHIVRASDNSFFIEGRLLQAKSITIDCTLSSQFASALLLSSKEFGMQKLTILPTLPHSNSYITMTRQIVETYAQKGLPDQWESDWSAAIFWYAWALLHNNTAFELPSLSLHSLQQDCYVATLFARWGITSTQTPTCIRLTCNKKRTPDKIDLDLSQNIDLAPIIAALAVLLPAHITLTGIANLNYKESERGNRLIEAFNTLCCCEYKDYNTLIINGLKQKTVTERLSFNSDNDHRLAMAFALFCSRYTTEIEGIEAIKKSYPNLL